LNAQRDKAKGWAKAGKVLKLGTTRRVKAVSLRAADRKEVRKKKKRRQRECLRTSTLSQSTRGGGPSISSDREKNPSFVSLEAFHRYAKNRK